MAVQAEQRKRTLKDQRILNKLISSIGRETEIQYIAEIERGGESIYKEKHTAVGIVQHILNIPPIGENCDTVRVELSEALDWRTVEPTNKTFIPSIVIPIKYIKQITPTQSTSQE